MAAQAARLLLRRAAPLKNSRVSGIPLTESISVCNVSYSRFLDQVTSPGLHAPVPPSTSFSSPLVFPYPLLSSSPAAPFPAAAHASANRPFGYRWLSNKADGSTPDSDDDFKPQYKKPEEGLRIHAQIEEDVKNNQVMVYMKGVPQAPMCGFSAGVVHLLRAYGVPFQSRNVLEDDDLRQGIKSFSQWPTIPQVYVKGDFVGGCDILMKMHEKGELEHLFKGIAADKQPA